MHKILAEVCPFESFCKLFAAYQSEVIVCKFYFKIGIFFLQITKVMAIWASYLFIYLFFLHLLLLDLQVNVAINKSL